MERRNRNPSVDDYIPFRDVPNLKLIPRRRGKAKLSVATIYRWASKGRCGVRLRVSYAGGIPCTTTKWLREFFDSVGAAEFAQLVPTDSAAQAAAEKQLQATGAM